MNDWLNPKKEVKEEVIEDTKPKFDLFKVMYSCFKKDYKPSLEEKQKISEWLFLNILANNEALIDLANEFNIREIPVEVEFDIIYDNVPKMYIPYPKKSKEDKELEEIMNRYNISKEVAKQYKQLLGNL